MDNEENDGFILYKLFEETRVSYLQKLSVPWWIQINEIPLYTQT